MERFTRQSSWAVIVVILLAVGAQCANQKQKAGPEAAAPALAKTAYSKLPAVWRSDATKHDFRVTVTPETFHAEWINVPAAAAKRGEHIRTDCRRAGDKWIGTSNISLLFPIPNAPPNAETKLCNLTVRFEVDSVTADKITGHSESLHAFDVNSCHVQQTAWAGFAWSPKK